MTNTEIISAESFDFKHIGWKYYNSIKKKAMEQEFSWAGLVVSLSIAFFIVITASSVLRLTYVSMGGGVEQKRIMQNNKIYQLEVFNDQKDKYLQPASLDNVKIEGIVCAGLA